MLGDSMNDKQERFTRVATRRTNVVLKSLQVLGNCSNRSAYAYTEQNINKIFGEIERVTKETKMRFILASNKNKEFKL